jgi:hypothetical protein
MWKPRFRHWIGLFRIIGFLLVVAGLAAGYFWFYYWGPLRHYYDPAWCREHSQVAGWEEYQECVHRSGWTHDGFGIVGRLGDKHWVEWIMTHIQPGEDIVTCDAGHKAHGLRYLTNQDAGNSAEAWIAWWRKNQAKSQEDWIREGFRQRGLELETPLTHENILALLKLMVYTGDEKDCPPDYMLYNAFRWLRDSDFDPETFGVKDVPAKDGDRVLQGLVRFSRKLGWHPKSDGQGVLNLGEPLNDHADDEMRKPWFATLKWQIIADTLAIVPFSIGLLLLFLPFRKPTANANDRSEA